MQGGWGRRLAVRVRWWLVGCSRWFLVLLYPPPPAWGLVVAGRDPAWFVRCSAWAAVARLGGRAPLGLSALCPGVAVSLGGLAVLTWCGAVSVPLVWRVPPPRMCAGEAVLASSPTPVLWLLTFPSPAVGGPPVVPCFCNVLPPDPCFRGCVPVNLRLSSPPCRGPSLCPFPFRCTGGGVVGRPAGRRWPIPGDGRSGSAGGGLSGCRGGGGPESRSGEAFPMPSAAWRPPGRCCRGRRGSGRRCPGRCGGGGAAHTCPLPPVRFTKRRSSRRAGADHQANWAAGRGGGGGRAASLWS